MTTCYFSHPECERHDMGAMHPESPQRLRAIEAMLDTEGWRSTLALYPAEKLAPHQLYTVHPKTYVDGILARIPAEGIQRLDEDTAINPHSVDAALYAAGAIVAATEQVIGGQADNAFCAVRPPGHHAEAAEAMGFCLFNSVALGAEQALSLGLSRVAILDFDVHHGNGTTQIFMDDPDVLVCSSFQYPFYPNRFDRIERPNICLTPLAAGTDSDGFRQAIEHDWRPALQRHQPELILVSAGFDAHRDDPLGGLNLTTEDYLWITQFIVDSAQRYCRGGVVSILEGGYNLEALPRCVHQHLTALSQG